MDFSILKKAKVSYDEFGTLVGVSKIAVYKWTKGGGVDKRHSAKVEKLRNAIETAVNSGDLPLAEGTPRSERHKAITLALVKHLRRE